MLEIDALTLLLLAMAGGMAGFVDAIAGGGGLITIPALLATGMPPVSALATNKLQSSFGALTATRTFWRAGLIDLRPMRLAIGLTFIGSAAGALLIQQLDASQLSQLLPYLLICFALYFGFSPRVSDQDSKRRLSMAIFAVTAAPLIGFYDGFFGPGTGSFFAIAFVALAGMNIRRATANTKLLNFTSNIASLLFFILGGHVVWLAGLVMACGQLVGARLGAGMVLSKGSRLVRPLLVITALTISIKLLVAPSV